MKPKSEADAACIEAWVSQKVFFCFKKGYGCFGSGCCCGDEQHRVTRGGMLVRTPGGKVAYHRAMAMTVVLLSALALRTVHCSARRKHIGGPHLQSSVFPRWGQHHQTRSSCQYLSQFS